jgi:hypothetical protein
MWPAVAAVGRGDAAAAAAAARNEVWITDGIVRVGEYKLITANCGGRGLTGTGGGWIRPATNVTNPYPNQGTDMGPMDGFLQRGCNKSVPCLYHVGGGRGPYGNDAVEVVNCPRPPGAVKQP